MICFILYVGVLLCTPTLETVHESVNELAAANNSNASTKYRKSDRTLNQAKNNLRDALSANKIFEAELMQTAKKLFDKYHSFYYAITTLHNNPILIIGGALFTECTLLASNIKESWDTSVVVHQQMIRKQKVREFTLLREQVQTLPGHLIAQDIKDATHAFLTKRAVFERLKTKYERQIQSITNEFEPRLLKLKYKARKVEILIKEIPVSCA